MGRLGAPTFKSLWLVEECLLDLGLAEEDAKDVVAALRETHDLR